jgi:hypothetical protein
VSSGILSVTLTDLSFQTLPQQERPIMANLDGDIVLTTIDQFPAHKLTLSAADIMVVATIDPNILPCGCIIREEGIGGGGNVVARGYIFDPQGQINEQGHTISLTIPNETEALRMETTGPGWTAATGIDTVFKRLASVPPPWTASVTDTGPNVLSVRPVTWYGFDSQVSIGDLNTFTKRETVAIVDANGIATGDTGVPVGLGWNVGALTHEHFDSGDGAITSVAFGCNTHRIFGLTNNFYTYSYEMMTHAIYLATDGRNTPTSGILQVFESGALKWNGGPNSYYPGDVLSVAVTNGTVLYLKNNIPFYASSVPPAYPCYGACSMFSPNSAILGATMNTFVAPKDQFYAFGFENATRLDAIITGANRIYHHVRQKWVDGAPVQELEIGLFGAPPTMTLKTAEGESPTQVQQRNPNIRLFNPQVDYQWTTSQIITVGVAQGASNGDNSVDLGDLYDYISKPNATPGPHGSVTYYPLFPEYDPVNFPIERRASLNGTYYYVVKNTSAIAAMKAKGHWSGEIWGDIGDPSIQYVDQSPDAQRQAVQRSLYVSCMTKLRQHGVTNFTATLQVDGRGRITQAGDLVNVNITRVGRGRHVGGGEVSFNEVNIKTTATVMSWVRQYREDSVTDQVTVSTLTRLLDNPNDVLTDTMRKVDAIQLVPTVTESDLYIGPIEQTINTIFPLDIPIDLPNTMYEMLAVTLRVTAKPARHNVSLVKGATLDGAHRHAVTIPALTVQVFDIIPHGHTTYTITHEHGGINGDLGTSGRTDISHGQGTSTAAVRSGGGVSPNSANDIEEAIRTHTHTIAVNFGGNPGTGNDSGIIFGFGGQYGLQAVGKGGTITMSFPGNWSANSNHGHADTIGVAGGGVVGDLPLTNKNLGNGKTPIAFNTSTLLHDTSGQASARDPSGQFAGVTTTLTVITSDSANGVQLDGSHTHNLNPDVVETALGSYFQIWIDSGDGAYVDRSPELGGPWNGRDAFIKGNISVTGTGAERFFQAPGKKVGVRIVAINAAGNPTGIQNVQFTALMTYSKTAYRQTIYAA